jgi:hypothetical protein
MNSHLCHEFELESFVKLVRLAMKARFVAFWSEPRVLTFAPFVRDDTSLDEV